MRSLRLFAGDWRYKVWQIPVNSSEQVKLADANPNRWLLVLKVSDTSIYVAPNRVITTPMPLGLQVSSPNGVIEIKYADWGSVVGFEWYAYSLLGTGNITVFEVSLGV